MVVWSMHRFGIFSRAWLEYMHLATLSQHFLELAVFGASFLGKHEPL